MNKYYRILMISTVISGVTLDVIAQEEDNQFTFSANVGYEFDSNITIDAIDSTSNVGDEAIVFDAAVNIDFIDNDEMGISAGYDFYKNNHSDLEQFDMTIHGFNIDGRYSLERTDFGMTYMFNTINLGGESFLDMHTFRPNVGYLMPGNDIYLMGSLEYQKQTFKQDHLSGRDATRNGVNFKAIFLLGEGRTFTSGYTYTNHDAKMDRFSYSGYTLDLSLKLPLEISTREATVRAGYRLQTRGYDRASMILDDEIRSDNRHTLSASLEVPIAQGFIGKLDYEYIVSNSTYEPVDYNESITTFSIGWEF